MTKENVRVISQIGPLKLQTWVQSTTSNTKFKFKYNTNLIFENISRIDEH